MKIAILNGSPRKNGNTAIMVNQLVDYLSGPEYFINIIPLHNYRIEPCLDCRGCKKGQMTCIAQDEMNIIYREMQTADLIVFATPIYWYGPTGKMKLLIDRLRPYFSNRRLSGKKAALLLPAAAGEADCDLTIEMFRRVFNALGIEYAGVVCSKAYEVGDAKTDSGLRDSIEKLTRKFA
jgi:multimeric flavodoxin WrbA